MSSTIVIVIVVVVVVLIALAVARSRRSNDGVDSFRRQIDALSPEARRPVIDQVQNAAGRTPPNADDDVDDPEPDDADVDDDDTDDEDGARGT
jgi:cytochrome oxidase Cu insertion factor (SCO1/SenC/PrrC family)